jgi:hypothetical protein
VTAGLVLIRMNSWADGWLMLKSLAAADVWGGWSPRVPVWVPLLMLPVALGHLVGGLRGRLGARWELPPAVRAAGYAGIVLVLVTLSPGVTKTFIYIQF